MELEELEEVLMTDSQSLCDYEFISYKYYDLLGEFIFKVNHGKLGN